MGEEIENKSTGRDGQQIREYINSTAAQGIVPGLDSIRDLLNGLGNPQRDLKIVHIAGTNGKGSVGAYLGYILAASGYLVGRYVSPAVFDDCEKFQILEMAGGDEGKKEFKLTYIKKEEIKDSIEKIKNVTEKKWTPGKRKPTVFEVETAVAFLELKKKKCDILILEAGMGGRLDATNIIDKAECSVIVSVSRDHMAFLGNTLEEIAEEKAGIIKEGSFVVSSPQQPEVKRVLKKKAAEKNAEIFFAREQEAERVAHSLAGIDFFYREKPGGGQDFHTPLLGAYQIENVLTALKAAWVLKEKKGYSITEETVKEGISNTIWHGRFEILRKEPYFVIDGAHNKAAAEMLAESIRIYFLNNENFHGKLIFIIGIFKDKEVDEIIAETAGLADDILTVTPPSKRGLPSGILKEKAEDYLQKAGKEKKVKDCGTVKEGVKKAFQLAKKEDAIIMFGSLSLFKDLVMAELLQ